jgi:O-antigen/teichoic acid export membrane protein
MVSRLIGPQLFRPAGIYMIANAINSAIPLLLLPILTRYLSPYEYGLVSMFMMVAAVVVAIASLGTHGAITREYFLRDHKQFSEFVGTCIVILATTTIVLLILVLLFSRALSGITNVPENWLMVAVLMGTGQLLCSISLSIWQVRGLPIKFGVFQISVSILNALLSLFLVIGVAAGWEGRVIGQVAAVTMMGALGTAHLAREGWIEYRLNLVDLLCGLRYGIPVVFHALGATAVSVADRTLIANLVGLEEAGSYVVATQIVLAITFLGDSFCRAYAPWLFNNLKCGDAFVRRQIVIGTYWYFAAMLLMAGILVIISPPLISYVIGQKFEAASRYIGWLSVASAFSGMYHMTTLYIQFSGKTERQALITLLVGALHIFMCIVLIELEGVLGAAQATALSQLLMFLATWWMAAKMINMDWFLRRKLV